MGKIATKNIKIPGLTPQEIQLLSVLSAENKRVFSFENAVSTLKETPFTASKILFRLVKKGWIKRIEKGKYLLVPLQAGPERQFTEHPFLIASELVSPYYIGYRTALNHYGLTEQPSETIYIATTRRKLPMVIDGVRYHFVFLQKRKFFGQQGVWIAEKKVFLSRPEKTVIDCLDHLEYAGGLLEVAKALWMGREELNFETLVTDALRLESRAVIGRLGFLMELYGLGNPKLLSPLRERVGKAFVKLDTLGEKKGRYCSRWKVIVNLSKEQLLKERG